jgi:hypothetical protein
LFIQDSREGIQKIFVYPVEGRVQIGGRDSSWEIEVS